MTEIGSEREHACLSAKEAAQIRLKVRRAFAQRASAIPRSERVRA